MQALSKIEIEDQLSQLDGWIFKQDIPAISRSFSFPDFKSALNFVNQVGELSEKENHHPDILLSWGKVEVTFWTHVAKGVTKKDFKLAGLVSKILLS